MDPIADLLTCIRNASQALKPEVIVPHSKIKESTVKLLKEEVILIPLMSKVTSNVHYVLN